MGVHRGKKDIAWIEVDTVQNNFKLAIPQTTKHYTKYQIWFQSGSFNNKFTGSMASWTIRYMEDNVLVEWEKINAVLFNYKNFNWSPSAVSWGVIVNCLWVYTSWNLTASQEFSNLSNKMRVHFNDLNWIILTNFFYQAIRIFTKLEYNSTTSGSYTFNSTSPISWKLIYRIFNNWSQIWNDLEFPFLNKTLSWINENLLDFWENNFLKTNLNWIVANDFYVEIELLIESWTIELNVNYNYGKGVSVWWGIDLWNSVNNLAFFLECK
jgi:hypothetical protein